MTRSLTGDWTRDLPHSKRALYHRRSRRLTFCLGYLIKDIALCLERNQNLIAIKTIYVCFLWRLVTILKNSLGMPWSNLRYINWSNVTFKFISSFCIISLFVLQRHPVLWLWTWCHNSLWWLWFVDLYAFDLNYALFYILFNLQYLKTLCN